MRHRTRLSMLLAALLATGCAKARNYTDPAGPIYVGDGGRPPTTLSAADDDVRVVTFNVKFARHVDRAIALLQRPGPLRDADVLVMQEMDEPGAEAVACALGMNHVYVPSAVHPSAHHDFGVAVLSPWPLTDAKKVPLPHEHRFRKTRRAAVAVTVRLPSGPVRVYGLHLESPAGLGGGGRRDQARAVLADASAWSGPTVVAGDFNGRGGAAEMAQAGYLWATERVRRTSSLFSFDHVLARGLCPAGDEAAAKEDDATNASDHDPVWAVLRPCPAPHSSVRAVTSPTRQAGAVRLSSSGAGPERRREAAVRSTVAQPRDSGRTIIVHHTFGERGRAGGLRKSGPTGASARRERRCTRC
jgi:endonuclease/exonuclease/phosphatase family metal-dependent hydrolase